MGVTNVGVDALGPRARAAGCRVPSAERPTNNNNNCPEPQVLKFACSLVARRRPSAMATTTTQVCAVQQARGTNARMHGCFPTPASRIEREFWGRMNASTRIRFDPPRPPPIACSSLLGALYHTPNQNPPRDGPYARSWDACDPDWCVGSTSVLADSDILHARPQPIALHRGFINSKNDQRATLSNHHPTPTLQSRSVHHITSKSDERRAADDERGRRLPPGYKRHLIGTRGHEGHPGIDRKALKGVVGRDRSQPNLGRI